MKTTQNRLKQIAGKVMALALVMLAPVTLMAQDGVSEAAMSDTTKASILVGMLVFQVILLFTVSGIIRSLTGSKELWKNFNMPKASGLSATLVLVVFTGAKAFAQDVASAEQGFVLDSGLENLLLVLNGVLLLAIIYLLSTLRGLVSTLTDAEKSAEELVEDKSWLGSIMHGMTDAVPVEEEEDILTDHDYDGIQELDNNLPPWWILGFYITIGCAVLYIGYYEFYLGGNISQQEYRAEVVAAEEAKEAYLATLGNSIDESNVEYITDASALAEGKSIYDANCVACHGGGGEGGVGPNLTDQYWLHGGGITDVFKTIKYGVPAKGMIPWEDQLTPPQMQQVASYVLTLKGTNPPNPKEPQGEIWEEEAAAPVEETQADSANTAEETANQDMAALAQ